MITESNPERYRSIRAFILNKLDHENQEEVVLELQKIHYFYSAKQLAFTYDNLGAITYLDSAYQLAPKNLLIHRLLSNSVIEQVNRTINFDLEEAETAIEAYKATYLFLGDDIRFQQLDLSILAFNVQAAFNEDNSTDGHRYFEEFMNQWKILSLKAESGRDLIGMVFGGKSSYLIRNKEENEGKQVLLDGLKHAPESPELRRKLQVFEEYELKYRD